MFSNGFIVLAALLLSIGSTPKEISTNAPSTTNDAVAVESNAESSLEHAPDLDLSSEVEGAASDVATIEAIYEKLPLRTPDAKRAAPVILPTGTPIFVMMDEEISTEIHNIGDHFGVTVLHDVLVDGTVIIPQGTPGFGDVTFITGNGGFGKPGIVSIALRYLELDEEQFMLDGRYREEGRNKNGATAATWIAVGVFAGFIRGKDGVIPQGRELKAKTGEEIAYFKPSNMDNQNLSDDEAKIRPNGSEAIEPHETIPLESE